MVRDERMMVNDAIGMLAALMVNNAPFAAERVRRCSKIPALAAEEDLAAGCRALADEIEAVSARAEDVFRRLDAFYRKWGRPE